MVLSSLRFLCEIFLESDMGYFLGFNPMAVAGVAGRRGRGCMGKNGFFI
jgi:hypothetical protein